MDTQHLPAFIQALAPLVTQYGYWAVAGLLFVEDFGFPAPGETTLITAAVFAGLGKLNIFVVVIVGFLAAVLGDNLGYVIGRFGGRRLLERFGKYILLTAERLDKAEAFFNRHGPKVVVIARFVEGLRQANGLIAGTTEMHWRTFVICNAIGAALWVSTWSAVGYYGGNHIQLIQTYGTYFSIGLLAALVAYISYRIFKKRPKTSRTA